MTKKDVYKVYVMTKKKDGTITKSEPITVKAENKDQAIGAAIKQAKGWYGYKGTVHIGTVSVRNSERQFVKL